MIAIMLHGALIAITYLAVVRPSLVQGRVIEGFAPYLASLHLAPETNTADAAAAEGMAFYLVRGEGKERVHRLQFKATTERGEEGWEDADFGGAPGSGRLRRQQRYLAVLATLGENEQNAMVARLILPLVARYPEAQMVRVTRLPNVMTNVIQEREPAPYTAAILRSDTGVRLVRVPAPRLGSAVETAPENGSSGDPGEASSEAQGNSQGQVPGGQS